MGSTLNIVWGNELYPGSRERVCCPSQARVIRHHLWGGRMVGVGGGDSGQMSLAGFLLILDNAERNTEVQNVEAWLKMPSEQPEVSLLKERIFVTMHRDKKK